MRSLFFSLLVYITLVLVAFIYSFGITGPLLLDDVPNLEPLGYQGDIIDWESARRFIFGNVSGPLGRPVSMASFLLDENTWPINSAINFKITNIAFHLCCGLAIFLTTFCLLKQEFSYSENRAKVFALFGMVLWLLHPLHVSSVLYVIQRMAILSAFFSLLAFLSYLYFRSSYFKKNVYVSALNLTSLLLFFMLAIFSKENALLLLPFILVCEVFLFESILSVKVKKLCRMIFCLLIASAPLWLTISFDIWGKGYEHRNFNFTERVVLQIAVIGDYFGKILFPTVSKMNLFDERFTPAAISFYNKDFLFGYFYSLLLSISAILALLLKNKTILFGLSWFLLFHALESSIFPLEIYFEHRNYLPSFGLIFIFLFLINKLIDLFSTKFLSISFGFLLVIYLSFTTTLLTKTWGNSDTLFIKSTGDQPTSVRAKSIYAAHLEQLNLPEFAIAEIEEAIRIRPDLLGLSLNRLRLSCAYDMEVDFDEIQNQIKNATYFETSALFQIKKIIEPDILVCISKYFHEGWIDQVFDSIPLMRGATRTILMANFYNLETDYYVSVRNFSKAVDALDKAISFTPTVDLLLRKVVLFASAGLYKDALDIIPLVIQADNSRRDLVPSRLREIEFLKISLENQLSKS